MTKHSPSHVACALAFILFPFTGSIGCRSGDGDAEGTGGAGGARPFCEVNEDCDDENECTNATCVTTTGMCEFSAIPEGTPCDGGDGVCRGVECFPSELIAFVQPPNPEPDGRFGTSVAIVGDTMVVGSPTLTPGLGSAALYDRTGTDWDLTAIYIAPQPIDGLFGWSVAIAGSLPLVGSAGGPLRGLGAIGTGSVRTYGPEGNVVARSLPSDAAPDVPGLPAQYQVYEFGASTSVSENTLVVGAPGHFGATLHLADTTQVVGTAADSDQEAPIYSGAAYVFTRLSVSPIEEAFLKASNADTSWDCDVEAGITTGIGDAFGASVAISGDTIAVGAPGEASAATGINGDEGDNSAVEAGAVYVFERVAGIWEQTAYIKASNTGEGDRFGFSVALDGDTLVVAAEREDSAATGVDGDESDDSAADAGAVYVFERVGGVWAQSAYLKASNTAGGFFFGANVAIDADTILIGSPGESTVGGEDSGAAYVFSREGASWAQTNFLKAFNAAPGSSFAGPRGILTLANDPFQSCQLQSVAGGNSLSISGTTMLVGAPFVDSLVGGDTGAVYIYENE